MSASTRKPLLLGLVLALVLGVLGVLGAACTSTIPATAVVVEVHADSDEIATKLSAVRAQLYPIGAKDADEAIEDRTFSLSPRAMQDGKLQLPFSFAIEKTQASRFLLVITGYERRNSAPVIEQKVTASFQDRQTMVLQVVLTDACYQHPCEALDETCPPNTSEPWCGAVPEAKLSMYQPGSEFDSSTALDAGPVVTGSPRDADGDARTLDGSSGTDSEPACMPAAACGSCEEGTHLCDGDSSTTCVEGRWQDPTPCVDSSCSMATGLCGVCQNGAHRCSANVSQICRDGDWVDDKGCGTLSCDTSTGLCGACSNGQRQCAPTKNTETQLCASGRWTTAEQCEGQTPVCWQGACAACAEPAQDCADSVPRKCTNGSWALGAACNKGFTCSAGECQCALSVCGSLCTDTAKNKLNCGTCGHSCLGGECVEGKCQPVKLAIGQNNPSGVVSNGTHVFWVASSAIYEHTLATGTTRQFPVASTQPQDCSRATGALLLHGGFIYWGNSSLCRMPLPATGAATALPAYLAGTSNLDAIAANSTDVYVFNAFDRWIESIDQGKYTDSSLGLVSSGVAADDAGVYFVLGSQTNGYTLVRHDPTNLGTGTATPLASGLADAAWQIAAFGGFVYYINPDSGPGPTPFRIWRVPTTPGGARTTVASGPESPGDFAVDSTGIYWTVRVANGTVMRAPLDGGPAAPIATGQSTPHGIALDDNAIYWTNNVTDGQVMRLAK